MNKKKFFSKTTLIFLPIYSLINLPVTAATLPNSRSTSWGTVTESYQSCCLNQQISAINLANNSLSSNASIKNNGKKLLTVPENSELNWYFVNRGRDQMPEGPKESIDFINKYDAYYVGDTDNKVIYLTFDEGYENGYTEKILDVLKEVEVPAAFFVVKPYITSNPDIIKRMNEEGHLVCNHSSHHPSMASITDPLKFKQEFTDVEDAYKEVCGTDMPKFFRPPMGKYSMNSLKQTKDLGYKTIFWSFAYKDWITDNQPTEELAIKKITDGVHPGCIMLLHAVSKTNTNILKTVIEQLKNDGYEFKSLNDLPACRTNPDSADSSNSTDSTDNISSSFNNYTSDIYTDLNADFAADTDTDTDKDTDTDFNSDIELDFDSLIKFNVIQDDDTNLDSDLDLELDADSNLDTNAKLHFKPLINAEDSLDSNSNLESDSDLNYDFNLDSDLNYDFDLDSDFNADFENELNTNFELNYNYDNDEEYFDFD